MVTGLEAAWASFCRLLRGVATDDPSVAALDRELDAFVATRPGVFEARLLDGLGELAATQGAPELGLPTLLSVLFDLPVPSSPTGGLPVALQRLDPVSMLVVHGRARREHLEAIGPNAASNALVSAARLATRAGRSGLARAPLAPEFRDLVAAVAFKQPLPSLLPPRIHDLSADEIEDRIARYLDLTPDLVTRRLRHGGGTGGEFLGAEDRLGQTILDDARTLHALGVDRNAIADRLDELVTVGGADAFRRRAWDVRVTSYLGHQPDPFHSADAYGVERRGATDFQILNHTRPEPNAIEGGDLLVVLVRRVGFFEGRGAPYRLDPALAARVLGLV